MIMKSSSILGFKTLIRLKLFNQNYNISLIALRILTKLKNQVKNLKVQQGNSSFLAAVVLVCEMLRVNPCKTDVIMVYFLFWLTRANSLVRNLKDTANILCDAEEFLECKQIVTDFFICYFFFFFRKQTLLQIFVKNLSLLSEKIKFLSDRSKCLQCILR